MVIRHMLHPGGGGGDSPKMFEFDSNKCDFRIRGGVDTWLAALSRQVNHRKACSALVLPCRLAGWVPYVWPHPGKFMCVARFDACRDLLA
jgi:hypothetical protein